MLSWSSLASNVNFLFFHLLLLVMYGTKHAKTHSFSSSFFRSFFFRLFFSFLFFFLPFFLLPPNIRFISFSPFVSRSSRGSFSRRGQPCNGNEESGKGSRVSPSRPWRVHLHTLHSLPSSPPRAYVVVYFLASYTFEFLLLFFPSSFSSPSSSFLSFPFSFYVIAAKRASHEGGKGPGPGWVKGVGGREGRRRRDDDTRFMGKRVFSFFFFQAAKKFVSRIWTAFGFCSSFFFFFFLDSSKGGRYEQWGKTRSTNTDRLLIY